MTNLENFLGDYQETDLLRIATAGSVDDGKSTLIGRLLYDSKSIFEDQLQAIEEFSSINRDHKFDYALVTDGLKFEREQGITIDVAYRFFSTPKRRFIIADTPGHEQYTRNMATGASTASLAMILVDARNGVMTQTKRHLFISSLLGIRNYVVVVNKMDLVSYSEETFNHIVREFRQFSDKLSIESIHFIPISALHGDNVIERSTSMNWYKGSPLLDYLENVTISGGRNLIDFRLAVQYVNWAGNNFRGYCGSISSGIIRKGEAVMVLPHKKTSKINRIITPNGDVDYAFAPQPVTITLEDQLDIGRGDMLVRVNNPSEITGVIESNVVWMDNEPLKIDKKYIIKHTTHSVSGSFKEIKYRIDPEDFHRKPSKKLELNEIGKVVLELFKPIYADNYSKNRNTGCFIVIDPVTNLTVGAGMISKSNYSDSLKDRKSLQNYSGKTIWLSGPEKRKLATSYHESINTGNIPCIIIDDDTLVKGLNSDINDQDGEEYLRRTAHVCRMMNDSNITVIILSDYQPNNRAINIIGRGQILHEDEINGDL